MINTCMGNQQPSSKLTKDIIQRITSGEIDSRRQLFSIIGIKNKKAQRPYRDELDNLNLLRKHQNGQIDFKIKGLRKLSDRLGRIPRAADLEANHDLGVKIFQNHYGSWNKALESIFGLVNQHRYSEYSNQELLEFVKKFIVCHGRIPFRDEFSGKTEYTPHYETYFIRFNTTKWHDIISMIDLSNVRYFSNRHGYGKTHLYKGMFFLSHQEYLIGRYLLDNEIKFEQEVPYGGNTGHRFDFYLPEKNLYIEYYGMSDKQEYKSRIKIKQSLYGDREVLEIYKHDNTVKKLAEKVQRL